MEIGVGLPTSVVGASAAEVLAWARSAEESGFSCLSVGDRLVWPGIEPLVALAAAAAATERIRLSTEVVIAPRRDVALLAEQTAALAHLSNGRLGLGVAAGARSDDYEVAGSRFTDRGRRLDEMLVRLRQEWRQGRLGPLLEREPQILIGGRSDAALIRTARHGDGTIIVAPPAMFAARARQAEQVWQAHGREGRPRLVAHSYFALGPDAAACVQTHLGQYYAFMGPMVQMFVDSALTSEESITAAAAAYREAGADELVLVPCASAPAQLALLAAAVKNLT